MYHFFYLDDANEDDVKALISEMETLAGLGPHPNIVSLVRVCTVGSMYSMKCRYNIIECMW